MNDWLNKLPQPSRRAYAFGLLCVVSFALLLRVGVTAVFVGLNSPPDLEAQPDQEYYEKIAHSLAVGAGYTLSVENPKPTALVAPGTSLTILPMYLIFGRSYLMARLWFCIVSALACLGVALTVRQLAGRAVALAAAAVMAVYPNHFYNAMHFTTETPYVFYMSLALALSVAALRRQLILLSIAGGCLWGAAALTRPQIVLVIPLALVCVLAGWRSESRWMLVRTWAIQSALVALMLLPWLIRNHVVIGQPVISTNAGHTLFHSHNELIFNDPAYRPYRGTWLPDFDKLKQLYPIEGTTELERDRAARQHALNSIRRNLDKMPALVWAKFLKFIGPVHDSPNFPVKIAFTLGWSFVGIFSIVGLCLLWKQDPQMAVFIVLPIVATLVTCLLFHAESRYRDSASAAFVALAGIGVSWAVAQSFSVVSARLSGTKMKC